MKTFSFIVLAVASITSYNVFLAHRDHKMFEAYDKACAAQPYNPNCIYAK